MPKINDEDLYLRPTGVPLSKAIEELFTQRGYARTLGSIELREAWWSVAEESWRAKSRAIKVTRGVLHIAVDHSALLSELVSFHRKSVVAKLQAQYPHLKIKDVKFQLSGL